VSTGGDPRIGTELAGFRIESLIGRGGMGVVYLAEQLRYGRKIALKILAPELAVDEAFRERFELEWRTAAKLEHPNIVPVYEAGEADGVLYIAMRYVDGIDLNALLGREGRLSPARALGIVGQVGRALDAAHAQGLVHRDVKPGNILVAAESAGEGEHVYLTDFGVAKQARTQTGLTRTGLFIGTVDYAAPEQIEGKLLDGRTDLYALGCVLYQCMTGVLPYEKDSEVAMLYAHLMEPPPSLKAKRPELPDALDAVIVKALAKEPDDRYATCREFVDQARRAAGLTPGAGRTVLDVPLTPTVQTASPPTAQASAPPTVGEPRGPAEPPPPRPRAPWWRSRWALIGLAAVVIAGAGAGIGIGLAGGGGGGETSEAVDTTQPTSTEATTETGQTTTDTDTGDTATGDTTVETDTSTTDTGATDTGATETASDFPNADEAALLAHVPETTRDLCEREDEDAKADEAIAGVACFRPKLTVFYDMFPDAASMNAYYDSQVSLAGATRDQGDCASAQVAEGTWTLGDQVEGRLLCFTDDARIIVWTDERFNILGYIYRTEPNRPKAYRFWQGAGAQLIE
jgi:serine/threonine-protein kinase